MSYAIPESDESVGNKHNPHSAGMAPSLELAIAKKRRLWLHEAINTLQTS